MVAETDLLSAYAQKLRHRIVGSDRFLAQFGHCEIEQHLSDRVPGDHGALERRRFMWKIRVERNADALRQHLERLCNAGDELNDHQLQRDAGHLGQAMLRDFFSDERAVDDLSTGIDVFIDQMEAFHSMVLSGTQRVVVRIEGDIETMMDCPRLLSEELHDRIRKTRDRERHAADGLENAIKERADAARRLALAGCMDHAMPDASGAAFKLGNPHLFWKEIVLPWARERTGRDLRSLPDSPRNVCPAIRYAAEEPGDLSDSEREGVYRDTLETLEAVAEELGVSGQDGAPEPVERNDRAAALVGGVHKGEPGDDLSEPPRKSEWTQQQLMDAVPDEISASTFRNIRSEAGLPSSPSDGSGPFRKYSPEDVQKLLTACESRRTRKRKACAEAWRRLLQQ